MLYSYVKRNVEERFTNDPAGLPGNDDYGTMSAVRIIHASPDAQVVRSPKQIILALSPNNH